MKKFNAKLNINFHTILKIFMNINILLEALGEAPLSYREVYNEIKIETDDFKKGSGSFKYDTLASATIADGILKDYYSSVYIKPLNMNKNLDLYYTVMFSNNYNNLEEDYMKQNLCEKIVKLGNKWQVQSENGKNMGTYNTKKEAEERLRQVEYFKHKKENYSPVFKTLVDECDELKITKNLNPEGTPLGRGTGLGEAASNNFNEDAASDIDRIRTILKDAGDYYDVYEHNGKIYIDVSWGDWKHDHIHLDNLMSANGYDCVDEEVTARDGSDSYSSTHIFVRNNQFIDEALVEPEDEDINFLESRLDSMGFNIDKKGKTLFGNIHYQVISKLDDMTKEDLRWFAKRLNYLSDKMDDRGIPMTYNVGLQEDGFISAGIDLRKKSVPDKEDSLTEASTEIGRKLFGSLVKYSDPVFAGASHGVLSDGRLVYKFYARNDDDAMKIFRKYGTKNKPKIDAQGYAIVDESLNEATSSNYRVECYYNGDTTTPDVTFFKTLKSAYDFIEKEALWEPEVTGINTIDIYYKDKKDPINVWTDTAGWYKQFKLGESDDSLKEGNNTKKFEIRKEYIDNVLESNGNAPIDTIFNPDYYYVNIIDAGDKYILEGDEANVYNMLAPFDLQWRIYSIDESLNEATGDIKQWFIVKVPNGKLKDGRTKWYISVQRTAEPKEYNAQTIPVEINTWGAHNERLTRVSKDRIMGIFNDKDTAIKTAKSIVDANDNLFSDINESLTEAEEIDSKTGLTNTQKKIVNQLISANKKTDLVHDLYNKHKGEPDWEYAYEYYIRMKPSGRVKPGNTLTQEQAKYVNLFITAAQRDNKDHTRELYNQHIGDSDWEKAHEYYVWVRPEEPFEFENEYNDELDSYLIDESLDEAKNETLNQALWDENNELKPEVKEVLMKVVDKFKSNLKEDGVELDIKDIIIVGSNANYNFTPNSDIDLHIVADLSVYKDREDLAELLYNAYRKIFNDKYSPKIEGYEIEIYVEPYEDTDNNEIPDSVEEVTE